MVPKSVNESIEAGYSGAQPEMALWGTVLGSLGCGITVLQH